MKKLFVIAFIGLAFTACKKKDTDQHCWSCKYPKTSTNTNGSKTTTIETEEHCGWTAEEIHIYERRYSARELLDVTYGNMVCEQLEDSTDRIKK